VSVPSVQTPPAPESDAAAKRREEDFHDRWALSLRPEEVLVDESFEAETSPENRWILEQLGDLRGKRVLDLGCGAGEAAVYLAKRGAHVVASDLSPEFLELVGRVAAHHGVGDRVTTHLSDADRIDLPPASFDVVYAANLLHHVSPGLALDRIAALLKPGGLVATWDPLRHNPVINVYRRMATGVRTVDERPLHIRDVGLFRERFTDVRSRCFWLMTLWIFLRFFLIERVHPNQDRYWKRIVRDHRRLTPIYRRWAALDRALLGAAPFLRRYCWNIAVVARKP
jgi:SAM-dependent methyltransferase